MSISLRLFLALFTTDTAWVKDGRTLWYWVDTGFCLFFAIDMYVLWYCLPLRGLFKYECK